MEIYKVLVDLVIHQMKKDIEAGDTTAIAELLGDIDANLLIDYLPEETVERFNSMPIGLLETEPFFTDDGATAFFIDDKQVSCVAFNDYFDAHDVGWQEDTRTWNGKQYTVLTIFTDDRG